MEVGHDASRHRGLRRIGFHWPLSGAPSGGIVLDPFTGSGSTGKAAIAERLRFVGFEQSAEYVAIAQARIGYAEQHHEG